MVSEKEGGQFSIHCLAHVERIISSDDTNFLIIMAANKD